MIKDKENYIVVPFAGSGSECVVAKRLKQKYTGFEINEDYVKLCNERLTNESQTSHTLTNS